MTEEVINAQGAEDNATEVEETTEQSQEEVQQTIEEMSDVPEKRVVDEHVFVAEKKARKAAEKELKALRESIENGASAQDVYDDISDISEEYDIDPQFLKKFASTIKAQTERDLETKLSSKLSEKERVEKFDKNFENAFNKALERGPEFSSIANMEVIKQLARLPQNSRKTVSQLLEETYGNALTGKRTIETTQPAGGKDPEPLDFDKAQKDIEYFNKVMADPKRKAQYNELMLKKGF